MMISDEQIQFLRDLLLQRQEELKSLIIQRDDTSQPVILDQQSVGRVSRIDAIQQQQMAVANKAQAKAELKDIANTLTAIDEDDYGFCEECDKVIPFERLQVKPTSTLCVSCQQKHE